MWGADSGSARNLIHKPPQNLQPRIICPAHKTETFPSHAFHSAEDDDDAEFVFGGRFAAPAAETAFEGAGVGGRAGGGEKVVH